MGVGGFAPRGSLALIVIRNLLGDNLDLCRCQFL
jgi:hypothetical protein